MSSSQTAKVTKLESLSDPEKVKKFIVDVTNAARKTEVKETKTDKTVVRGNLGMLIKARVIPYANKLTGEIVSPDGNEDVLPGENFGATKWSEDLFFWFCLLFSGFALCPDVHGFFSFMGVQVSRCPRHLAVPSKFRFSIFRFF